MKSQNMGCIKEDKYCPGQNSTQTSIFMNMINSILITKADLRKNHLL